MNETITNFLNTKKQAAELEAAARKEMQTEFNGLLGQAAELYDTFKSTFGTKLNIPSNVRFSIIGKPVKRRKAATQAPAETPTNGNGKKIGGLKRSLATQQKRLEEAQAAGKPTKDIEDKIYEITDELTQLGVTPDGTAPAAAPEEPNGQLDLS